MNESNDWISLDGSPDKSLRSALIELADYRDYGSECTVNQMDNSLRYVVPVIPRPPGALARRSAVVIGDTLRQDVRFLQQFTDSVTLDLVLLSKTTKVRNRSGMVAVGAGGGEARAQ